MIAKIKSVSIYYAIKPCNHSKVCAHDCIQLHLRLNSHDLSFDWFIYPFLGIYRKNNSVDATNSTCIW